MSNETSKSKLDISSIVSLKAELIRKQEEYRQKKQSTISISDIYETNKTQSTWGKKKKIENQPTTSNEPESHDQDENTEEKLLEKSRKMLESKAKYYEEVVSGKKRTDEGDEEIFLVNFDQKVVEEELENTRESNLNLKREMNEEEYNKYLKEKWEKESNENLDKGAIHYHDIRFDEIRNMGVGNFQFSRVEEQRKQQMEFFKNIEKESKTKRISNEIYKLKREKILLERLRKVKQKRLLKFGYSLDQIKELCKDFETESEVIDNEISELEQALENSDLNIEDQKESIEEGFELYKPVKRTVLDREWDKPKLKEKMWVKHVEKLRAERNKMFAPPQAYETSSKKKTKKRKNKPKVEEEPKASEKAKEAPGFMPNFNFPPPQGQPPGLFFPPFPGFPPMPPMFFPFPPP